jgi:hypothetical protein
LNSKYLKNYFSVCFGLSSGYIRLKQNLKGKCNYFFYSFFEVGSAKVEVELVKKWIIGGVVILLIWRQPGYCGMYGLALFDIVVICGS